METTEDLVAAAGHSVDAEGWLAEFDTGFAAIAGRFAWLEPRFKLNDQQLGTLEDLMFNRHQGDEANAVQEWLKANPDFLGTLS